MTAITWNYPQDGTPPDDVDVFLLRADGKATVGRWGAGWASGFVAWYPLPRRDAPKELAYIGASITWD